MNRMLMSTLLSAIPLTAAAQEINWELVDTGTLDHSAHGLGVELRIQPNPVPEGLFQHEGLSEVMAAMCDHYAPLAIPYVQEQTGLGEPDFVAVRVITGGAFGRYALQAYEVTDGDCGDEL